MSKRAISLLYTLLTAAAIMLAFASFMPTRADTGTEPQFSIGAIADFQYADEDDAGTRLYRRAPAKLREAIARFNAQNLDFVVHLGDFIDRDWPSYETALPIARTLRHPWYFVLGNHDFSVTDDKKPLVPRELGMPARYYSFEHKGWAFVVLDGNDLSTYAWPEGDARLAESREIRDRKYPTAELWDGGIGEEQMRWLDKTLAAADRGRRKVMILCHFPVYPENRHNLWNAAEVVALLERHPSVKIWLNGHNHDGNYGVKNGIHYLNLKGMLDTTQTSYAVLDFYEDRVEVHGAGRQSDFVLALRP